MFWHAVALATTAAGHPLGLPATRRPPDEGSSLLAYWRMAGSLGGVGPFLQQRAFERKAWTTTEMFPTRGDKGVRCQSIRGRMEISGLFVPADASWLPDLRVELVQFPFGVHDDCVDAFRIGRSVARQARQGTQAIARS
jgi:hypothetical protein